MRNKQPEKPTDKGDQQTPPPGRRGRSFRLKSMNDVRVEMARVYSESRRKQIDLETAKGQIYMLSQVGRIIEGSDLERRVDELAKRMGVPA